MDKEPALLQSVLTRQRKTNASASDASNVALHEIESTAGIEQPESDMNACASTTEGLDEAMETDSDQWSVYVGVGSDKLQYLQKKTMANQHHWFKPQKSPPFIAVHPIPATGRDNDIATTKKVIDDLRRLEEVEDQVIFAPDHKMSSNLLKLQVIPIPSAYSGDSCTSCQKIKDHQLDISLWRCRTSALAEKDERTGRGNKLEEIGGNWAHWDRNSTCCPHSHSPAFSLFMQICYADD